MHRDPPPTLFARSNGIELAYDSFGDPDAQPLLLIMGLGTQMIAWDEAFCEQLAARGYRVIRFDNRDIGQSTRLTAAGIPDIGALLAQALAGVATDPARVPYTLTDMADDAVGLLDALGIASAHIVGASMGGAIAQEIALRHPRRVRTLVSIMATSGGSGLPPPRPEALQVLMTPAPTDRDGYIARQQQVMKILRAGDDPEEEALDAARAQRAFERGLNPPGYARQLAAIIASGSRRERLSLLRTPTLVIHGDADPLVPIECGMDVARSVPGARMVTIPNMGHALPKQTWAPVIDAIADHAVWTD
ncbi:alpha/beta fold hydrolase [Variovorax sp. JS1663]|uniref:alpha/beta fold hydrolase n=1 Tax=Variovorax sp. JS1663 TaxID=1851577 RepID=UPI000B342916|nr:alpha/beta fold hydrolase [Variovorax sp. JS1663]OUM02601.1 alpha/beta hydrolase [Variovorax sp. JS1663]